MRKKCSVAIVVATALTGCSYSYDLKAVVIDGRLAFVVDAGSKRTADCVRSIQVSADKNATTVAGSGDDKGLVENGAFWWKNTAVTDCLNQFPILYGQPLEGQPFLPPGVEAKPLKIGVAYSVTTSGSGSGYGSGRFRIRQDRTVENLPLGDLTSDLEQPANGS